MVNSVVCEVLGLQGCRVLVKLGINPATLKPHEPLELTAGNYYKYLLIKKL